MSSRITVKKNLIIFHNKDDWSAIRERILKEHGSRMTISFVMRRDLGFTVRNHTAWISSGKREGEYELKYPEEQIHLDFYSESVQTWFQLRYLNL